MLKYVIIFALVANAVSFFIVSRFNKHILNQGIWQTGYAETTTYLICGMMPRSKQPFDWLLEENCPIKGGVHAIFYQNFGFDPRVAARQIGYDIYQKSRNAIFITLSLGAEIPLLLSIQSQHIAIDPCIGRQSLKRFGNVFYHIVAILLELVVFVLGWLAFLPVIKSGENRFSLALYADWLYWATIDLGLEDPVPIDGLIISRYDDCVNGDWLDEHVTTYNEHCKRKVPCGHCEVEDFGPIYKADLSSILCHINFRSF